MIFLDSNTELTVDLLQKMINRFQIHYQPTLQKRKNYYDGKQSILSKSYSDASKPCNRIVTNYCKIITETYSGYICGKPISYSSNDNIDDVQEAINYNDDNNENIQWVTNALIYGVSYELMWLDKFSQVRYSQINPLNAFAIYDNTLESNLLYFVRWYDAECFDDNDAKYVEVYSATDKKTYKTNKWGESLQLIAEEKHFFKDVPVSVFWLNDTGDNIFDCVISLQDAYNELQSAEIDDFSAWVDAYLLLSGMDADTEDIAKMKENRVLIMPEDGNAQWLVKNASDTQIVNMLQNIKENVFKVTACPDMADENFLAQSGTALAYKLVGFENVASGIVARFTKAIQRRIELLCNILNLKASDAVWRDINISFVRNLPVNLTETIQLVTALKGTVSDKTLLSQIPWIDDIDAELEAVKKQKEEQASLYSFDMGINDEEDDEE